MYAQPNKKNVTYLDDLPQLEDLESTGGTIDVRQSMHGNHEIPPKFQKFIRNPGGMQKPPYESGMGQSHHQQHFFAPPPQQQEQQVSIKLPNDSPTCLEIHDHVQTCPICSRFFKNDNTVYIIAIVILSIICILLLKKVLNL